MSMYVETLVKLVYKGSFSTTHQVYRSQLRGWLLTSLVLLTRAGVTITPACDDERKFLQGIGEHAKAMPT